SVVDGLSTYVDMSGGSNAVLQLPTVKVTCSSPPCTVYPVTYASMNTAANSRIKVYANASEIPDFSAWTVVPKAPTITRLTSGSGTYVTPSGVRYLRVRMVGGGAGGNGSGTSNSGGQGAAGGDTTFGTSLLIA